MSSNTNIGNTPVNQGYVQLIHTGETGGIDGTLRTLYDGDGTASDLQIASNKVKVSTELFIGSDTLQEYIQDTVGAMLVTNASHTNLSAAYDDAGDGAIDLTASGEVTLTGTQTLSNKTLTAPTLTGTTQGASITLSGDLTVNGTTTTVNQTNLDVSDNIIGLNRGAGSNANDSGLIIERGSTGDNAAIIWDESADKFTLGTTTSTPSATGNLTISTGTLVANVEGNVSGNLTTDSVTISTIQTGSESFADNDTSLMTSAAIQDKITSYGYVTSSGISFDGSTANGVLTFKDSDEATVESTLTFDGTDLAIAATGKIYLDGGGDSFIFEESANNVMFKVGNNNNLRFNSTGAIFNDAGASLDFRVEGDTDDHLFFVDGSADKVGISTNSPGEKLDLRDGNFRLGGFNTGSDYGVIFTPADAESYWHIYNDAGGHLAFGRSATIGSLEKMRIDSSGNVGIGVTNPSNKLQVDGNISTDTFFQVDGESCLLRQYVSSWTNATTHDVLYNAYQSNLGDYIYLKASGNGTNDHGMIVVADSYIFMGRDNHTTGALDNSATAPISDVYCRIDTSGNALFDGDVVAYSTTIASDERLKENVKDLHYGLKDVLDIRPVSFDWKKDKKEDIGVIAQEIEKIIPEIVVEVDTLNSEDTHKTVDYAKLTSVLIKAIQEQQQQINKLEDKLNG